MYGLIIFNKLGEHVSLQFCHPPNLPFLSHSKENPWEILLLIYEENSYYMLLGILGAISSTSSFLPYTQFNILRTISLCIIEQIYSPKIIPILVSKAPPPNVLHYDSYGVQYNAIWCFSFFFWQDTKKFSIFPK